MLSRLSKILISLISFSIITGFLVGDIAFGEASEVFPPYSSGAGCNDSCHTNSCKPQQCSLCHSSCSSHLYFFGRVETPLPNLDSHLIEISLQILPDQGFVKSIFRPPIAIL